MRLTVFERPALLGILPPEGDLTTLRIVRQMKEQLSFSEEEHKALDFRQEGERLFWRHKAQEDDLPDLQERVRALNEGVEIALGPKAREIVRQRLEELSTQKKLRETHLSLCDKFELEE